MTLISSQRNAGDKLKPGDRVTLYCCCHFCEFGRIESLEGNVATVRLKGEDWTDVPLNMLERSA